MRQESVEVKAFDKSLPNNLPSQLRWEQENCSQRFMKDDPEQSKDKRKNLSSADQGNKFFLLACLLAAGSINTFHSWLGAMDTSG